LQPPRAAPQLRRWSPRAPSPPPSPPAPPRTAAAGRCPRPEGAHPTYSSSPAAVVASEQPLLSSPLSPCDPFSFLS
ncbi:hypothetical protein BAE44_0025141, partial [Dichanthelium oligosanthes]